MRITIFPEVKALPSPEERCAEGSRAKFGKILEVKKDIEFKEAVTKNTWSPFLFENNQRLSKNFKESNFLVYDVDDGMNLKTAIALIKEIGYDCFIGTTSSHQKEKNGTIADRFRLIFPLMCPIISEKEYKATWESLSFLFPVDSQCKDLARFYFACREVEGIKGFKRVKPQIKNNAQNSKSHVVLDKNGKGLLSYRTRNFLENGAETGKWHEEFLYACRDIKAQGYIKEEAIEMLRNITGTLDTKHDLVQINYVYENNYITFEFRGYHA